MKKIKVVYCDDIKESIRGTYFNIIKDVLECVNKNENESVEKLINRIELHTEEEKEWKGFGGYYVHFLRIIKIKVDKEKIDNDVEFSLRELLYHEVMHALFEWRMIKNNNIYLYEQRSLGIEYINEYLAYYNGYKYISKYYEEEFQEKIKWYWGGCKGDIRQIYNKYNGKLMELTNKSDLYNLINSLARKVVLMQLTKEKHIKREYNEYSFFKDLPTNIDYKINAKELEKIDVNVYRYLEHVMWVE